MWGKHVVDLGGGFLQLDFGEVGVDVHGGLDAGVAHELHGGVGVEAVLPAEGGVVVAEGVGGDQRGVVGAGVGIAPADLLLFLVGEGAGEAGGLHELQPEALGAGLGEGLIRGFAAGDVIGRQAADRIEDIPEGRRQGEDAGGLPRLQRAGGAVILVVDVALDADPAAFPVDIAPLEAAGLAVCGASPDGTLVEMVELPSHPFDVGCQFHPEFKSRPTKAHPLFRDFIAAALEYGK